MNANISTRDEDKRGVGVTEHSEQDALRMKLDTEEDLWEQLRMEELGGQQTMGTWNLGHKP